MADKYIFIDTGGNLAEREATTMSTGAADAGKIVALNNDGKIDPSMLPDLSTELLAVEAGADLNAGDFIYIVNDNGTPKAFKAVASDPAKAAVGFIKESVTAGNLVNVYFEGVNDQLSGLLPGMEYFLSDATAGTVVDTPPSGAGHIVQKVGVAINANSIAFERAQVIVRA